MSTRTNIIIKKAGHEDAQLYHHSDGYPEGVGKELAEDFFPEYVLSKEGLNTPEKLGRWIEDKDCSYEYEGKNYSPHGDIDYLYTIDMDEDTISCDSVNRAHYNRETKNWDRLEDLRIYEYPLSTPWDEYNFEEE